MYSGLITLQHAVILLIIRVPGMWLVDISRKETRSITSYVNNAAIFLKANNVIRRQSKRRAESSTNLLFQSERQVLPRTLFQREEMNLGNSHYDLERGYIQ